MKIRSIAILLTVSTGLLASGCAGTGKYYYWGDYSNTLYACRKNPCEKTRTEHKADLERIISESDSRSIRVPPGVYAELGHMYLQENKPLDAIRYFELEEKIYPEARVFMENAIRAVKARDQSRQDAPSAIPTS